MYQKRIIQLFLIVIMLAVSLGATTHAQAWSCNKGIGSPRLRGSAA
jgi:hypothetical protein